MTGRTRARRTLSVLTEQCLAPVPGGTGRYSREVAAAVATAAPAGWTVRSVTAWHSDTSPAAVTGTGRVHRLPAGRRALAALWERGLPPWIGGSVVHAPTPLAPLGPRRSGPAVVVTVHDVVPWTHPEALTPRGAQWHRTMIARAGAHADAIVVPTSAVAAGLAEHTGITGRVHVIGEAVASVFTQPVPPASVEAARRRFALPEGYLVTVGTLEPRKGIDVLLQMLSLPEARGWHLVAVGPLGWGRLRLDEEIRRFGLTGRVHLLGRLPDADLVAVLAGASVSVTPSRAEGFGLPVLEAMAMGVPVVHSDIPALVEVAGGAGNPFTTGDPAALARAVGEVLDDPARAAGLVAAGRARAADYSWDRVAEALWELYAAVAR